MSVRRWSATHGLMAMVAVSALVAPPLVARAADVGSTHPASIQVGTCASPGEVLAPLADVSSDLSVDGTPSSADAVGVLPAIPVQGSLTTVSLGLTDLLAAEASITVSAADGSAPLVCGDIGGRALGDTGLPVALAPVDGSGWHGLAVLQDLGHGGTSVAVYLTADTPDASAAATQSVEVGSSLFFAGFDITVEEATIDPVTGTLDITATFRNLGTGTANLTGFQLDGHPVVVHGTDTLPLRVEGVAVPSGAVTRATLTSGRLPEGFSLDRATLVLGQADQHQASVELTSGGIAVSETPQTIRLPRKARSASIKGIARITISRAQLVAAGCTGGRDAVVFTPTRASELSLVLTVTVQGRARLGVLLDTFATAPDGTSGVGGPGVLAITRGDTARDLLYCYTVPSPGPGRYSVRFEAGDRHATIRFRVPTAP